MDNGTSIYRNFFYHNPLSCWVYELNTFRILDVNKAALKQYGYTKEEFLFLTIKDFSPREEISQLLAAHQNIQNQDGNIFFGVFTHQTKLGGLIRVEINGYQDNFQNSNCILAVCQDITLMVKHTSESNHMIDSSIDVFDTINELDKKIEQEERIQQSEQRFKALVQESSDFIGILNAEGNYTYVSPTSTSIVGIAPEEFIGRNATEFIHPDDVERTLASLQRISTENRVMVEPIRFQNHKKEWRWFETVLTNMLDNPAVKGIVANSRDITDKTEKKHKLKLLESVITNIKDAIIITEAEPFDEPGPRIIFVNEAFTKMTGYEPEEVIGKSPRILQGPNSNKEELLKLSRSLRNWEPYEITTINYKKNGEEFWINFTITPVCDEKGWYTHWIAIERDVTEQKIKEIEKELLAQISINFSTENDLVSAANELCKSIGKFGKFDWVELWTANLEKSRMQLFSHYVAAPKDEEFYDYSSEISEFDISESLGGKVWAKRQQLLWDDIENNNDFIRKGAAKKIGLKAVLGIPLIFNDEMVGILKIGTKYDANYLKNYTKLFKRLEEFIGSELNRKKLEYDLSHLFNAIPDILCLLHFDGRFLKVNKSGCDLMGFSQEAILNHRLEEFVHPQDKGIFTSEVRQLKKEETTFKFENRFITKSGEIIWLSWYCNAALKENIIYATAKNITEEKKLRELNRQAGSLAKIGSWEMDLVKQNTFWSDEVHYLHETDPKLFVPNLETGINFYREDFRQIVQLKVEKCIATREPFDFEAVLITAKKKELWVRATGNAEFADGELKRIYGSFQDIHERKEAEIRLQSLADNLPGVVFQYLIYPDGTDTIQYVTKGSQQIWGFAAEEVLQNSQLVWNGTLLGGEMEKVKKSIADSIEFKTKWTTRWKYAMPNGEIRTHLGYGTPNFLADGTVLFHSVILDVTQEAANEVLLEQYTLELERSNEELEQFAFVASHDLQEPLRMISSFMNQLKRKYADQLDERGHQYIYFATDGAKRMKQIILDLLDYSRASRPTEGKEAVDMNEILAEFKQLRRKLISEKKAIIESDNLPTLNTYKAAITQILHCIIDNALKYTKTDTSPIVKISVVENEKEWEFSIKDNGIGIDPQFYDKIFIIFQRLHNKDEYSGTGIGLSIAKRHVEFLGGHIWVKSIPEEGTIFYFTIPKIKKYE